MNKNLTEIVFILDRSGSMSGLESDTIGGFNAMIEKQKKAPGEALVSTILFDNVSEVIHDRVNIRDIKPMTDREYCVRGCTALLDAIGGAIHPSATSTSMRERKMFRRTPCSSSRRMEWKMRVVAMIALVLSR